MKKYLYKFKFLFVSNIVLIVIDVLLSIIFAFVIKELIDISGEGNISELKKYLLASVVYIICSISIAYFRRLFQAYNVKNILIEFKNDIFNKIINTDIKSFSTFNSAKYISNLTNDLKILEEDYFLNIFEIIYYSLLFIISAIVIMYINIYISLGIFVTGILPIIIVSAFGEKLSNSREIYSKNLTVFTSKIKDIFSGFEIVKSFNIENIITKEYRKVNEDTEISKLNYLKLEYMVNVLSGMSGYFMLFSGIAIGTYFVIQKRITIGEMIACVQLMNNIISPLINILSKVNSLNSTKSISKNLIYINNYNTTDNIEKVEVEKTFFSKDITFEDVSFGYAPERKIINNFSFQFKQGGKYAIVGKSGSGKSTLIKLLIRYFDNYEGSIKIDGVNINDIKTEDYFKIISVIHQNVFVFDDTLENNITLYSKYREEELRQAMALSGLNELLDNVTEGLNTQIGEGGNSLSGGEKQRISIARSIIRKAPVLVMDEALASLDNQTAWDIENSILDIPSLTCINVTHKLNCKILKKYDAVIVLKNGEIEEFGHFDELMERKGYFYNLYNYSNF
ncbi:MAG: ABC transporter ATP-binding protein [Clostridiales bacterium]|nr:ABC transporter ATP-binding protein [Clostridiales bacterium]HPT76413.1 ABC transporter ATP-binding protein [Defluviitaleaceae bacterium]